MQFFMINTFLLFTEHTISINLPAYKSLLIVSNQLNFKFHVSLSLFLKFKNFHLLSKSSYYNRTQKIYLLNNFFLWFSDSDLAFRFLWGEIWDAVCRFNGIRNWELQFWILDLQYWWKILITDKFTKKC